jgi:beta-glucuronidase
VRRPAPLAVILALTLIATPLPPVQPVAAVAGDVYTASDVASLPVSLSLSAIDGVSVPIQNGIPVPSLERQNGRTTLDLGGTWKKQRVSLNHTYSLTDRATALAQIETEASGRHTVGYDDSAWSTKTLPGVENTMVGFEDPNGTEIYENGVWYRRTFTADASWSGKYVKLAFQSVNYIADVWINGVWVGYHEGGYTPFAFDVSSRVTYGATNTIAIRVDNVPWGTRTDIVPAVNSDWMNYTGVIQDVFLEVSDQLNVVRAEVRPLNVTGDLTVRVPVFNRGASSVTATVDLAVYTANVTTGNITDPSAQGIVGSPVSVTGTTSQSMTVAAGATRVLTYSIGIPSPALWSPATPNLYILKASLKKNGSPAEDFYTQFGVRILATNGPKLLVNNRAAFFVGSARHEDWADSGRTATMAKIKTDLDIIKATNINFLRTAHYPNHPYTYLLADRIGIAISEELPAWWHGTYEWADQNQRKLLDQMWREMIFRDYNRPSILFWSTMNEPEGTSLARRQATIERLHRDLDLNFLDGRFVIQAASADRPGATDPTQSATDVAAWTMYFGVFHGGTYYQGTLDFMDAAHAAYPNKPILNIEYGRISGVNDEFATEQQTTFVETFNAFEDRKAVDASGGVTPNATGYLATTVWWTSFNWYTQREFILQTQGATHMDRTTHKPVRGSIQTDHAPYFTQGGLSSTTLTPSQPPTPSQSVPGQPASIPSGVLQDFEFADSFYNIWQEQGQLTTEKAKVGSWSLKMTGTGGDYHTIGAYLYGRPVNTTGKTNVCVWIYDTVGQNTVAIRLIDSAGNNKEVWTTTRSLKNKWKLICLPLSSFSDTVNLTKLAKVQLTMFWNGVYYWDHLHLT